VTREDGRQDAAAVGPQGPVKPGSLLHRILQRIALEVVKALENRPPTTGRPGPER
jgi:hypothetical protein